MEAAEHEATRGADHGYLDRLAEDHVRHVRDEAGGAGGQEPPAAVEERREEAVVAVGLEAQGGSEVPEGDNPRGEQGQQSRGV
jgi:hypothetical protein